MLVFSIAVFVIIADQVTKFMILNTMRVHQTIPVIEGFLHITYVQNYGGAFGLMLHRIAFFSIPVTILVILSSVYIIRILPAEHTLFHIGLASLLGGAVSNNLIDRVRLGYVVDFIDFRIWPVFNVADIAIVIGIGLLFIDIVRNSQEKAI